MRILVLAPSYGTHTLVRNSIALFQRQVLRDGDFARMLIYCDDGLVESQEFRSDHQHEMVIIGTNIHVELTAKYNKMLLMREAAGFDAYVVWDIDDVYLPTHILHHSKSLDSNKWSHPSRAYSTYGLDMRMEPPRIKELAHRHYHGALAIRHDLLLELRGWPVTDLSNYDKQMLSRCWDAVGPPGDPILFGSPTYVYRWSDSGFSHISAGIKNGKYPTPRIHESPWVGTISPKLDEVTKHILGHYDE